MKNCFDCSISKECECGKMILELDEYLPSGLYENICDIIKMQFDCEYFEGKTMDEIREAASKELKKYSQKKDYQSMPLNENKFRRID